MQSAAGERAEELRDKGSAEAIMGLPSFLEVLSAYYCLAVAVLGQDDFAAQPYLWNLYTAKTFEEIERLLEETIGKHAQRTKTPALGEIAVQAVTTEWAAFLRQISDEAVELYLHDKPTLSELAHSMPDYSLPREIEKVYAMDSWTCTFTMKAQIRIMARMGVPSSSFPLFVSLSLTIWPCFTAATKTLKQLRPVLVE